MKQNTKDWIQYASAILMLCSAVGLALWSFSRLAEVHSTVLTYAGIAVSFCGAVYGLALYAKNEVRKEVRRYKRGEVNEEEDETTT